MPLTRARVAALALTPILLALLVALVVGRGGGLVDTAAAHAGGSFCHGEFTFTDHGAEGECTAAFQGFPVGVVGNFDAADPEGHAEVHVEIFAELSTGFARPLGVECESEGNGAVTCEQSSNPIGAPLTAPEPAPAEIVALSCRAHSHAHGTVDPEAEIQPGGTFACWSTDEAREALVEEGFPRPEPEPEPEPEPDPGPTDPGGGGSVIASLPGSTYAPGPVPVDRALGARHLNLDLVRHDVVALDDKRPDGSAPWCDDYAAGDCPLFWSPLADGGGEARVLGLEDTEAGGSYRFFCSIHPYMVGTIEVVN